jgi:hypothetical protein
MSAYESLTRAEHLAWAKERALAYLPDWHNAMASFCSDLGKHKETAGHSVQELLAMHAMAGLLNERSCRELIEGTR